MGEMKNDEENITITNEELMNIEIMNETNPHFHNLLWWALALGACLGGNITIIGASANIVSIGIARKYGVKISFLDFMKFGAIISIISLIISSLYLILCVNIIM